ncbi:MAG: HAMP domain-containing histidine kinase [Clostridium sp.]|nr:HAMP domain-containing histidine kinase [Clostridium sp.]
MEHVKENFKCNNKRKRKNWIFPFISLIYIYLFSLMFSNSMKIYILLNDVLCVAVAFSLGLICFLKRELKYRAFYKNIGTCFFLISLVSFSHIFATKKYMLNLEGFYFNDEIVKISYYIEYFVILTSYILEDIHKKIGYGILIVIKLILGAVASILIMFMSRMIPQFNVVTIYILWCVLLIDIYVLYKNKVGLNNREKNILYMYLFLITVYHYISSYCQCYGNIGIVISLSLKLLSYYVMFFLISKCLMEKSYESMKDELENVHVAEKELNNILNSRNDTLLEIEYMIEKSSENYSELIEQMSDGIVIFYYDKVYYINSEAKKCLGIDESLDRYSFNDFCKLVLNNDKLVVEQYDLVKKNLKEIALLQKNNFEFDLFNNSGKQCEIYFLNIDSIGRLIYIKDVTEANKNYEFNRKYEEYLKAEELKNEFYSNISHELRTPINLIYSALQLSEMNLNYNNISKLEKNNEKIKHSCLRLIRTISNFIDANKISEGYLKPDLRVYNIVSVVENISLACNTYMKKINNSLIFDSQEEEVYVNCDKEMIERIILNILSNSVKFGKNGGVIEVNIYNNEDEVIIKIKNNGYIVSEEEKPYVFDKFTKVNKSLNRKNEGSGLGLYLSKALVELNKGTITFESCKEIGTEFTIKFPIYKGNREIEIEENYEMIDRLKEKVDIEFSDIYI